MTGDRTPRQFVRLAMLRLIGKWYSLGHQPSIEQLRSILLIRPDHLGDMLFLTPALHALRKALPNVRISLLAGPWSADVVRENPDLDAVLTCRFPGFERQSKTSLFAPYRMLLSEARTLQASGYDTAVVLRFDHWWGAWLAAAAGISRRVGYDWPETRSFLTQALPYHSAHHEVKQNERLLATLAPGKEWDPGSTHYNVTSEERAWAEEWLNACGRSPSRPLVAIHPGAGAPVKQWPIAAWAQVADELVGAFGAHVLLTGSADERELTRTLAGMMTREAFDAAGQTSLGQLAALLERCTLALGSDCGPLHLAVAVGVPTVHLYGPVSPAKFGPWGDPARHIVLTSNWSCAPCNRLDWRAEEGQYHKCMEAITPDQVLRAAQRLLQEGNTT